MYNFKFLALLPLLICLFANKITAQDAKIIKLKVSDAIYVPQKDRIYASYHKLREFDNSFLYCINPYTGVIEETIQMGYQINKLAVSYDGKYLYIAEYGNAIYRYDLNTKKIDLTIKMGIQQSRPDSFITLQLKTMPQKNNAIAIVRGLYSNADYPEDVVIYEDDRIAAASEKNVEFSKIALSKNPDYIYCSNGLETNGSLYLLQRKGAKLETVKVYTNIINLFSTYDLKSDEDGYLYNEQGGLRMDIKNIFPEFEGYFKPQPAFTDGHPFVSPPHYQTEPSNNFVYTISDERLNQGSQTYLSKFSKTNYLLTSKMPLFLNPDLTYFKKIIRWGVGSFAVITDAHLILVRDCTPSVSTIPIIQQGANINLCRDSFITLSANPGYAHYFWTTGDTGRTIKINYSATNPPPSSIFVAVAQQEKACFSNYSNPLTIKQIHDVPKPQILSDEFKNDVAICQGDSVILISFTGGQKTFIWSDGSINEQLIVKKSGNYAAKAISLTGCIGPSSDSVKVTTRPFPNPPRPIITLVGDSILCQGEQAILKTTEGYPNYQWSNNSLNNSQIIVSPTFPTLFKVRIIDNNECRSGWSDSKTITSITIPSRPLITVNDKLLATSIVAEKYQWFLNDVAVNGATQQFHLAKVSGKYTVQAFNGRCSSSISNSVSIVF